MFEIECNIQFGNEVLQERSGTAYDNDAIYIYL